MAFALRASASTSRSKNASPAGTNTCFASRHDGISTVAQRFRPCVGEPNHRRRGHPRHPSSPMNLIASVRDLVQLRTRLRRFKELSFPSPPPPARQNTVDPNRLVHLHRYRPEVPGHAEIFLRDTQE